MCVYLIGVWSFLIWLEFDLILPFRLITRVIHDNISGNRDARARDSKVIVRRLISVSRVRISESYTSAHSTNIVVPDSGTCARRWRTPAIFHVPFSATRNEGGEPFTSEGKHVTFPKGVAPTKKHDLVEGGYRDRPSLKRFFRGPSIRSPLFDCRVRRCTWMGLN